MLLLILPMLLNILESQLSLSLSVPLSSPVLLPPEEPELFPLELNEKNQYSTQKQHYLPVSY